MVLIYLVTMKTDCFFWNCWDSIVKKMGFKCYMVTQIVNFPVRSQPSVSVMIKRAEESYGGEVESLSLIKL